MISDLSESYQISVHWEGRPEGTGACAARVVRMLENLLRCHPAFDRWNDGGWTRREASVPFSTMPPQLEPMIRRLEMVLARDREGRPLQSPTYYLNLRNTALGLSAKLYAVIGCPPSPLADLVNRVQLYLPGETEPGLLKATLLALIDAWEPATGSIDPPGLDAHQPDGTGHPPRPRFTAGWVTYLAPPLARLVTPPPAARVEATPGGGLLLIATEQRFDIGDPGHLAACEAIQAALAPLDEIAWPPESYLRAHPRAIEPESAS